MEKLAQIRFISKLIPKLNYQTLYETMKIFVKHKSKISKSGINYLINLDNCTDKCIDDVYNYLVYDKILDYTISKLQ
jgi:hypothetical protein